MTERPTPPPASPNADLPAAPAPSEATPAPPLPGNFVPLPPNPPPPRPTTESEIVAYIAPIAVPDSAAEQEKPNAKFVLEVSGDDPSTTDEAQLVAARRRRQLATVKVDRAQMEAAGFPQMMAAAAAAHAAAKAAKTAGAERPLAHTEGDTAAAQLQAPQPQEEPARELVAPAPQISRNAIVLCVLGLAALLIGGSILLLLRH